MRKSCLDAGADFNAVNGVGLTALYYAAKNNLTRCFDILLNAGADGYTALDWAAKHGSVVYLQRILNAITARGDLNACRLQTALLILIRKKHPPECEKMLLGAMRTAKDLETMQPVEAYY